MKKIILIILLVVLNSYAVSDLARMLKGKLKELKIENLILKDRLGKYENKDIIPTQFETVKEMFEYFGVYTNEEHTLFFNKEAIILSPSYYKDDELKYIIEDSKRAFIYAVYKTFIHTNREKIDITIIPHQIDTQITNEDISFRLIIKRAHALDIAKDTFKIEKFSDLVGVKTGTYYSKDLLNTLIQVAISGDNLDPFFQKLANKKN